MVFGYRISMQVSLCLLFVLSSNSFLFSQDDSAESLIVDGRRSIQDQDWDSAVDAFAQAVKVSPDNPTAWQLYGYSLHAKGDLDAAIKAHKKATEFEETRALGYYNLGCVFSMRKDADKSFENLNKAAESGFDQLDHIQVDPDLENVRSDKRFQRLLAKIRNGGVDPFDAKSLLGTWAITSGTRSGEEVPKDRLPDGVKVSDESFSIPAGPGQMFVMAYELDSDKSPMQIDFEIKSGPVPSGKATGIFEIDGDTMKLCYDSTGENRPDKFETSDADKCFMFVMRRKPAPKFDAEKMSGTWECVKGTRAGADVAMERMASAITISKSVISIPAGETEFKIEYKIDASKNPVAIDMKVTGGPAPEGSAALGIVKFEGGFLYLCYDPTAEPKRPGDFNSTKENNCHYFKLKPAKE